MGRYLDKLKRFDPAQSAAPQSIQAHTVIEPAATNAKPIYWETGTGQILGPAVPEFLAKSGDQFWIVTTFKGHSRWINADRLKSKKAFENQVPLQEVEPIRF